MTKFMYNSFDLSCKQPFGAVSVGQVVKFSLHLPISLKFPCPVLKIFGMDSWDNPIIINMQLQSGDYCCNTYSCEYTPQTIGAVRYLFEIVKAGAVLPITKGADNCGVFVDNGRCWQLTVHVKDMQCPSILTEGVMYQIFPDRFYNSGQDKQDVPYGRELRSHEWGKMPYWQPNNQGEITNSDYFGGDLLGIEQKLSYLKSLGVSIIYLNPIFEAHSSHRYNTADYTKIDPLLGTNDDFKQLCASAKALGISIILDGVFSHTGSDSVYFNKERRYGDDGAYNNWNSQYREWFSFEHYPNTYESWWGFLTLPNVNELTQSYLEFICGENGIIKQWLNLGAAGFRLDVADELPDEFLKAVYTCIKSHSKDNAVIGEVWEDASNKHSYGVRRQYLLGQQMDSVMNYPFKDGILHYIRYGGGNSFYCNIMQIMENYPKAVLAGLMNSLSTHDTVRAITALAGSPLEQNDRSWQKSMHYLPEGDYNKGVKLFMLACILQYGLPGIPCIYYGDEAGVCGYRDPFNRTCFPWGSENQYLLEFLRSLGKVREDYKIFATADFQPITFSGTVCTFLRKTSQITIAFAINRSAEPQQLNLPDKCEQYGILALCGGYNLGVLEPFSGVVLVRENVN